MEQWVIPRILPTSLITKLPDEVLEELSEVAVGMSQIHIERYIKRFLPSVGTPDGDIAAKLNRAFAKSFERAQFFKDPQLAEMISGLRSVTYESVTLNEDLGLLKKWRDSLTFLINHKFFEAHEPYVGKDELESSLQKMNNMGLEYGQSSVEYQAVQTLISIIRDNVGFWRSAPGRKPKGTPMAFIIREQDRFELILYGLNFIIEKIEKNENPRKWRML